MEDWGPTCPFNLRNETWGASTVGRCGADADSQFGTHSSDAGVQAVWLYRSSLKGCYWFVEDRPTK